MVKQITIEIPEQILAIKPSPKLQARVSELLANGKAGTLSHEEETELDRYLFVEHMARLAKARAYEQSDRTRFN